MKLRKLWSVEGPRAGGTPLDPPLPVRGVCLRAKVPVTGNGCYFRFRTFTSGLTGNECYFPLDLHPVNRPFQRTSLKRRDSNKTSIIQLL